MAEKIQYGNKAPYQTLPDIPEQNKTTAENMNEIKKVVNNNATELDNTKDKVEELDQKMNIVVAPALTYRGSVTNYSDLSTIENPKNGDIYSVTSENKNYVYADEGWIEYTAEIDLSEINSQIQNLQSQINNIPTIQCQVYSRVLEEEVEQNTNYEVPEYPLGNNSIEIYFEGSKLIKDINYIEADSTHIQFKDWDVPIGSNIEIIIRKEEE
jgi:vacuolar-type H+-ATPase subunit I/STV1